MAASGGLSEAPPDEVLGGDLTDTTTGESTSQAAETTAEKETVVEVPPAEPPVASEPKPIRWHSLLGDGGNYVRLSPEQAELLLGGDVLSALPDRGCLTFEVRDGSLVITGWEGADKV
jgi:hypothetical protein